MRRRRRHSFLRGRGSARDRRTHARIPDEEALCSDCGAPIQLLRAGSSDRARRLWGCTCGAAGTTLPDGSLVRRRSVDLPDQPRYRRDGSLVP